MKNSQIKRKTPLRPKRGLQGRGSPKKRSGAILGGKKRHKKSELQKLKAHLWNLCREITRQRYGNTCYTCGKTGLAGGNWQTGHFIPSSVCSTELRYDLDNLRPQCYHDNINLSGNWPAFEAHLMIEKGRDFPDQLKARNEATKGLSYRADWYLDRITHYRALVKGGDLTP